MSDLLQLASELAARLAAVMGHHPAFEITGLSVTENSPGIYHIHLTTRGEGTAHYTVSEALYRATPAHEAVIDHATGILLLNLAKERAHRAESRRQIFGGTHDAR